MKLTEVTVSDKLEEFRASKEVKSHSDTIVFQLYFTIILYHIFSSILGLKFDCICLVYII